MRSGSSLKWKGTCMFLGKILGRENDVGFGIINVTSVTLDHLSNANNDIRSKDVKGSGEILTRSWSL